MAFGPEYPYLSLFAVIAALIFILCICSCCGAAFQDDSSEEEIFGKTVDLQLKNGKPNGGLKRSTRQSVQRTTGVF